MLLGAFGAGAVLVAGCGERSSDGAAGAARPSEPAVDADSDLVERMGGEIGAVLLTARATARRHKSLRTVAQPFVVLHLAHLEDLDATAGDGGTAPATPAAARAALLRAEEKLQRSLVRAALKAESGALAQVFASMAAAIAQRRAVTG